ncbi:CAP domain-containing protein [Nocardioides sp. CFH 31398]|uniref:CAP domain-containing protein n=1 Tax=Nocardioides sp. CFH 31398 TaxID=2919579 RepID=UPI001F053B52|nr:CAP domain-containing protein [Nocardioides sp. CFH 31398]MCH1867104.1 CAP domain-containing protein [Nocardioides sp. CFH 31398]
MTPRLRRLGASLLLATSLGIAAPAQATPDTTSASVTRAQVGATNAYSRSAFTHTNRARAEHERPALRGNACLRRAAQRQAEQIARAQALSHQDLGRIQRDCGVGWVGENVAAGYATGRDVVAGWMGSTGHRDNILSTNYNRMGIAAVKDDNGTWWAAQVFGSR